MIKILCSLLFFYSVPAYAEVNLFEMPFLEIEAENNDLFSQILLGGKYYQGEDVAQDKAKAFEWWNRAASHHFAPVEFQRRMKQVRTRYGKSLYDDMRKHLEWMGQDPAFATTTLYNFLADIYYYYFTFYDANKAHYFYAFTAAKGNVYGQRTLGFLHAHILPDTPHYDPFLSFYWFNKAAEQDDKPSQYMLGQFYQSGYFPVQKNAEKSIFWYEKSAEKYAFMDDAKPERALGRLYKTGDIIPRDDAKSVYWYERASKKYNQVAQYEVAMAYYQGRGVEKDIVKAAAWLKHAVGKRADTRPATLYRKLLKELSPEQREQHLQVHDALRIEMFELQESKLQDVAF